MIRRIPSWYRAGSSQSPSRLKQALHSDDQLFERDRLGEVQVEPGGDAGADVVVAAVAGQRDAAHAVALELRHDLQPAAVRQTEVAHQEVERSLRQPRARRRAVHRRLYVVPDI